MAIGRLCGKYKKTIEASDITTTANAPPGSIGKESRQRLQPFRQPEGLAEISRGQVRRRPRFNAQKKFNYPGGCRKIGMMEVRWAYSPKGV